MKRGLQLLRGFSVRTRIKQESAAAAQSLREQAERLSGIVGAFKLQAA